MRILSISKLKHKPVPVHQEKEHIYQEQQKGVQYPQLGCQKRKTSQQRREAAVINSWKIFPSRCSSFSSSLCVDLHSTSPRYFEYIFFPLFIPCYCLFKSACLYSLCMCVGVCVCVYIYIYLHYIIMYIICICFFKIVTSSKLDSKQFSRPWVQSCT